MFHHRFKRQSKLSKEKISKMASNKKGQRKRKSAGVGDIFEVCEKDLSPEPEEPDAAEPEAKVQKTRNSDVSESRRNSDQHNLNEDVQITTSNDIVKENQNNESVLDETVDILDISESDKSCIHVVEDSLHTADLICVDSDDDTPKSETKSHNEIVNTDISSSISSKKEGNITSNCADVDYQSSSEQNTEVVTVDDDQDTSHENDVIMVYDSTIDESKDCISLHSPEIINNSVNDDTLEDGEVNDSNLGEPETSALPLTPSITITFNDDAVAQMYKRKFCKFIQSFVELEAQNEDERTIYIFRDSSLDPKEWVVLDNTVCNTEKSDEEELAKKLPITPKPENAKKKKRKKKVKQQEELFIVDTQPGAVAHSPVVTKYSTKFLINDQKPEEEKDLISKPSSGSICFNCGKEHALRECTVPRNFNRINANRQKFQNKSKPSRYHVEEDQKYAQFTPGKISPDLRKALGLKKYQIPSYVYQMRLLGYPPGWLEEAKFVSSDLTMFDIDGKDVRNTNAKQITGLDPEKVIEYPGYNAPLEKEFKDEYRSYRVPPFCNKFNKEALIESFKRNIQREEDDFETKDMDLDNTSDSELQNKQIDSSVDSDTTVLSLQELQKQKDSLLEEIKKSGETIPWQQPSDDTNPSSVDESRIEKPKKDDSKSGEESSEKDLSEGEIQENSKKAAIIESKATSAALDIKISSVSEKNENSTSSKVNTVKSSIFGTPIIKSSSPYNRLPNVDNFTKGVSPVIDFENLPNSTGKYEQMTGVLQKVRTTLKNLHKSKT